MFLTHCTITGVDNDVDILDMARISKKFPFVEWGILFYPMKEGQPRYPEDRWVQELLKIARTDIFPFRFSAHLCGDAIRATMTSKLNAWSHMIGDHRFPRYQLNIADLDRDKYEEILGGTSRLSDKKIIIQMNPSNMMAIKMIPVLPNVQFLFDTSGGQGRLPKKWPQPISGAMCGYAGGLGPDNIKDQLVEIENAVGLGFTWVDMESNVRTDNKLDMEKVEAVLERCGPYILK